MGIYCVKMFNDEIDMVVGYATTKEKAEKMIDILKDVGLECSDFEYYYALTDTLEINDEAIPV